MDQLTPDPSSLLLIGALALWAFSFYFGHRFLAVDEGLLWANHRYLEDLDGPIGQSFGAVQLKPIFKEATTTQAKKSEWARRFQFLLICGGAIAIVGWKLVIVFAR
ncbi:hypothetical protein [Sulfitobacter sp. EhC04]|uniref:hypothetical protein n=1 Tax=Sulfitobacter sp. EhC04 TaxID=1849168 RepID=UPI0013726646|nr:hypothetical protein [Sulfitobacter sp. EhC04]